MSANSLPRAPVIESALELARIWCSGHMIDGAPALGHAIKVARKVYEHLPSAPLDLLAAVIVHDSPYFAPADIDLDAVLTNALSRRAAQIVRAIEAEHEALDRNDSVAVDTRDREALIASAADKVISISSVVGRGRRASDPDAYWRERSAFTSRVPYFQHFAAISTAYLPCELAVELTAVVAFAAETTTPYRE